MTNWTFSQKAPIPQTSDIYFPNSKPLLSQKQLRNSAGHFFLLGIPNGEACSVVGQSPVKTVIGPGQSPVKTERQRGDKTRFSS